VNDVLANISVSAAVGLLLPIHTGDISQSFVHKHIIICCWLALAGYYLVKELLYCQLEKSKRIEHKIIESICFKEQKTSYNKP